MDSLERLKHVESAPNFMGTDTRYTGNIQSSDPFLEDLNVIRRDLETLNSHKQVEKEVGFSIILPYKAALNGIWYKEKGTIKRLEPDDLKVVISEDGFTILELYFEDLDCAMDTTGRKWYYSHYGKDWALERKDLEHE